MRWISRILGALVLLVVVAAAGVLFLPTERIAQVAADQLRTYTGRDVRITGDVSLSLWPTLGAEVAGLEVGNADWSEAGPMLTAENAAIGVDARALLSGEIRITEIRATAPTIRLETRADGRASWQFTDASGTAEIATETPPPAAADSAGPRPFSIARLDVTDATLIYAAEGAATVRYSGVDLALNWPDAAGQATIDATLRPTAEPVTVAARIEAFAAFLRGEAQPVTVELDAGPGRARLEGRAGLDGAVTGALALDLAETDGFLRALGLDGAALPRGLGRSLALAADLTLTPARLLSLENLAADLGAGNSLGGTATVDLDGTPRLVATLDAGALDLTGLTGAPPATDPAAGNPAPPGEPGGAGGWSSAPIDASALAAFEADMTLTASAIDFGPLTLGATRVQITNERSRLVLALAEAVAYSGQLSGEFVVNNRDGLSVGGNFYGAGLAMQSLLADLVGFERLTGDANAELEFLGAGGSVSAIMSSLRGSGRFQFGQGTIQGIDLDALMRGGAGNGTTVFDSLGGSFAMNEGSVFNDDLLLQLRNFEVRGAGRVGLGARDMDYRLTPVALKMNDGRGLAIPVRLRGPWGALRVEPDLAAAIELNLDEERRDLENRVEERIGRELGVERQEGQSVEDAVRDRIENEVSDRLRRLFD